MMLRFVLATGIILLSTACQTNNKIDLIDTQIEVLRQRFAPDKRVAIFQLKAVPSGANIILKGETNLPAAKEAVFAFLEEQAIPVVDSISMLPSAELSDKTYGVVRVSACNIRSKPSDSAELSTQSTLGTPLRIYKQQGNWFYIQTPDGYLGWLYKGGFTRLDKAAFEQWQARERVVYLPEMGFSYASTEANASVVSDLLAGNILALLAVEGDYLRVGYPDGREAYLQQSAVLPLSEWLQSRQPNPENILATAQNWMGRPYLWGGTSGKGVDCSGFTKSVFYLNGLMLPRDASQQVHVGKPIATDTTLVNLVPGDFLFFGTPATDTKKERIKHVAIYMGDGKIIHSAELVKIESLRRGDPDFAEDRLKTFLKAKRMLQTPNEFGIPMLASLPAYQPKGS
ncbi:MAG: C40 family peptidase [Bacteroidota bacterium]